jgi:phosphoribosylamine--glycine ligase
MGDKVLGAAGDEIIIEEFIDGQELSYLVFTDGRHYQMMPASQDHKRINDNDEGANTGGMGAYCPAPLADETLNKEVEERVIKKTIAGIVAERLDYTGILYAGIIVREGKISVLEFNCRFGDPETQSVLPLLDTDLSDICLAILDGGLDDIEIAWKKESAVCIVLASGGYPAKYKTGFEIKGLDLVKDAFVFHAGTKKENGKILTSGGRVLNVVSKAKTVKEAIDEAYKNAALISFEGAHYRKDIAQRALKFESEKISVSIIAGSDSDLEIIRETTKTLDEFGLKYCINIASAHRTPQYLKERIEEAIRRGAKVFIAGAGMAAALPGAVAAETTLPVIGIPISGKALSSFDSLFSIVQMPRGVPVAALAIGRSGAVNAAVLAAQIIAISDKELSKRLCEYKKKMADIVISKDLKLQKDGIDGYLGKSSD